jgi:ABC-type polysaccharide/polyol phosphate export permease
MRPLRQTVGLLRLYWAEERGSSQLLLFNAFAVPLTFGYMGTRIAAGSPETLRYWMAGSITLALGMSVLSQVGFAILNDRHRGRLDLLKSSPVTKASYCAAQLLLASAVAAGIVILSLALLHSIDVAAVAASSLASAVLCGMASGCAIGALAALLASRARSLDSGNAIVSIASIALVLSSPVFYDLDALPVVFQPVALLSPFTHVAELLRAVIAGDPLPVGPIAAILALSVVYGVLGYRGFRWQE